MNARPTPSPAAGRRRRSTPTRRPSRLAPGDPYAQAAERRALLDALAALAREFREAVVLCDVAGLGATEAADVLGVPAGTVKSRVFRARAGSRRCCGNRRDLDAVQ